MNLVTANIEDVLKCLHATRHYPSEAGCLVWDLADLGEGVVSALIAALSSEDCEVRSGAAIALIYIWEFCDKQLDVTVAIPPLVEAVEDPAPWVRFHAAKALLYLTDEEKWARGIVACLDCDNAEVRVGVAESLRMPVVRKQMEMSDFIEHLGDPDLAVRFAVADAIRWCGEVASEAIPKLMEWVNSDLADEMYAASIVIPTLDPVYREALIPIMLEAFQLLQPSFRPKATYMLGQDQETLRQAVPVLSRYYSKNEAPDLRLALIQVMAGNVMEMRECLPVLVDALLDDLEIADAAAHGLAILGPEAAIAVPNLISVLEQQLARPEPARRRERNARSNLMCAAINALAGIGPKAASAVPVLKRALHDTNEDVRGWAEEALKNRCPSKHQCSN